MVSIAELQTYLRCSARRQYVTISAPPFTLFFHPTDPLTFFNYAIPDEPVAGDLGASLPVLREAFESRGRSPRIEFIQEFAPQLASALAAGGFVPAADDQAGRVYQRVGFAKCATMLAYVDPPEEMSGVAIIP